MHRVPKQPAAIRCELSGYAIDADGDRADFEFAFSYDPADPFAVAMIFICQAEAKWVFARELLSEGIYAPQGDMDVHIFPFINEQGIAELIIELESPDGSLAVYFPMRAVHSFVTRMLGTVPIGDEDKHTDFDREFAEIFQEDS